MFFETSEESDQDAWLHALSRSTKKNRKLDYDSYDEEEDADEDDDGKKQYDSDNNKDTVTEDD